MRETANYKLNLWETADEVGRENINGNFSALDAALKGEAEARAALSGETLRLVCGQYTGAARNDDGAPQHIDLGARPRVVFVTQERGFVSNNSYSYGGIATAGFTVGDTIVLDSTGFSVRNDDSRWTMVNQKETSYFYLALM